ncbi:ankyrin [Aspergillus steynii IBT 23096]|uniref:Ankyrin n=1 Tax=Aspergillus steynii IBT 23096 TaxID=1392250 RepID=A0A2I2GPE0_9EURO|nr:ankyrin [Aspergillus steynii IBT 23096]PLB54740.1 ankyrin [Aspergillus steynii IBT 23096]
MAERGISTLPGELIIEIAQFLDPVGVSQFSQARKSFYELLRAQRRSATRKHSWSPERHYSRRRVDPVIKRLLPEDEHYDGPNTGPIPQLLLAIHQGRAGVLRGYLEAGVDPNRFWGRSRLLSEAAYSGDMECVKVLLEYGANPGLPDKKIREDDCPRTALSRAASMIFRRQLRLRALPGFQYSIFNSRIWKPGYDRVTRLMKAGVKITHMGEVLWTRWQVNFLDVLKLAVEQGTDLSKLTVPSGTTVLHIAISYAQEGHPFRFFYPGTKILCHNDFEIVEWIITKYPDLINTSNARGETPFYWAFDMRRFDIARLLLLRGFELGFAEIYDWYLEITMGETSIEKVELLLEIREQLMHYDGVYHPEQLREQGRLMLSV